MSPEAGNNADSADVLKHVYVERIYPGHSAFTCETERAIRVALDTTVLGTGQKHPGSRTGIHRVVEHLALGLAEHPRCDLALVTSGTDLYPIAGMLEYVQSHEALAGVPMTPGSPGVRARATLLNGMQRIREATERAKCNSLLRLPAKVTYRAAVAAELRLALGREYPLGSDSVADAEVYHSTWGGLPHRPDRAERVAYVATVYDLIPIRFPHFFEAHVPPLLRDSIASITPDDWVLTNSEATRADLCDYSGIDPSRVVVASPAASPDLFHPVTEEALRREVRMRYGIPDEPYLLSLCTLEPRKNLDHAIRCFARLVSAESVPDLHLVLVGSAGWGFHRIFEEAGLSAWKHRVHFTGRVAEEHLAPLFGGALAFVYPSLIEGFGLPPLEAMQCGIPVITSNTSSLPEVVGDAGIMVDPTDQDALCQAMLDVWRDADLRQSMAAAGLERARRFTWEGFIERVLEAYDLAIRSAGGLAKRVESTPGSERLIPMRSSPVPAGSCSR